MPCLFTAGNTRNGTHMIMLFRKYQVALLMAMLSVVALWSAVRVGDSQIEELLRGKLVAANLLTRIQLEGERMRRFEKEMFIYVQDSSRRETYFKAFDAEHDRLLADLDTALAPSASAFDDAERAEMLKWKLALSTYAGAFGQLADAARRNDGAGVTPGTVRTTLDFNTAIGPGKDAFRALLAGSEEMRTRKKADPLQVATDVERLLTRRVLAVGVVAALGSACTLAAFMVARRRPVRAVTSAQPAFST